MGQLIIKELQVGQIFFKWAVNSAYFTVCKIDNIPIVGDNIFSTQDGHAECSHDDVFSLHYGMWLSLKRALAKRKDLNKAFRKRVWQTFFETYPIMEAIKEVKNSRKLPANLEGHTFFHQGDHCTVVGLAWMEPKNKVPDIYLRKRRGGYSRGIHVVPAVIIEWDKIPDDRFIFPKSYFIANFQFVK